MRPALTHLDPSRARVTRDTLEPELRVRILMSASMAQRIATCTRRASTRLAISTAPATKVILGMALVVKMLTNACSERMTVRRMQRAQTSKETIHVYATLDMKEQALSAQM